MESTSEELATTSEALSETSADLESTSRQLDTTTTRLNDTTTELNDTKADLAETSTQLGTVTHDLTQLEDRVVDLEAVEAMIAERTPLIPQTSIGGFTCTGSMEPKITCMDEARWLDNYDPNDIVVGAVIDFTPADCDPDATDRISHRVIEIRMEGGLAFRAKGDNNPRDDDCCITPENVYGYITALYKDVRPEFGPVRDRVNTAYDATQLTYAAWEKADKEYGDYVSRRCPNYVCPRDGVYRKAKGLYDAMEAARVKHAEAVKQWECKIEEAKDSAELDVPIFRICA